MTFSHIGGSQTHYVEQKELKGNTTQFVLGDICMIFNNRQTICVYRNQSNCYP